MTASNCFCKFLFRAIIDSVTHAANVDTDNTDNVVCSNSSLIGDSNLHHFSFIGVSRVMMGHIWWQPYLLSIIVTTNILFSNTVQGYGYKDLQIVEFLKQNIFPVRFLNVTVLEFLTNVELQRHITGPR